MTHNHRRLIVFDIDGTLMLSGSVVRRLFAQAFEEVFETTAPHEGLAFAGRTDRGIVRALCERSQTSARFENGFPVFAGRYSELMARHYPEAEGPRMLPGVRPLLEALTEDDRVSLMVGSGNLDTTARIKLRRFELDGFFPHGVYGNCHEEREGLFAGCLQLGREQLGWDGEPSQVWFVGDTVADVRAAKALGSCCLGVGTGPPGTGDLAEAGADASLVDLSATGRALAILLA